MLIMPAVSSGMMEIVPFLSSILSMKKIEIIDVNAIVICVGHKQLICQVKQYHMNNFRITVEILWN